MKKIFCLVLIACLLVVLGCSSTERPKMNSTNKIANPSVELDYVVYIPLEKGMTLVDLLASLSNWDVFQNSSS